MSDAKDEFVGHAVGAIVSHHEATIAALKAENERLLADREADKAGQMVVIGKLAGIDAAVDELRAENERLREALEQIERVAGNLHDDILCSATGPNDARYRGVLVCQARDIARAALTKQEG